MNQLQQQEFQLLLEFDRICTKHNINYMLSSGTLLGAVRHQGFIPWDDDIDVCLLRSEYDRFKEVALKELDSSIFYQDRYTDRDYFHPFAKLRMNDTELKEKSTAHLSSHHGVWLDIFPMDNIPDDLKKRSIQKRRVSFYHKLISVMLYTFPTGEKGIKEWAKEVMFQINKKTSKYNPLIPYLYLKRDLWIRNFNSISTNQTNMLTYNYDDVMYESTIIDSESYKLLLRTSFEGTMFLIPSDYDEILTRLYGDYLTPPSKDMQISNHYIVD